MFRNKTKSKFAILNLTRMVKIITKEINNLLDRIDKEAKRSFISTIILLIILQEEKIWGYSIKKKLRK